MRELSQYRTGAERQVHRRVGSGQSASKVRMSEKVGEIARESSVYRCEKCHQVTRIARGDLIPTCSHCGSGSYDIFNPRFERRDGTLGPHEPG